MSLIWAIPAPGLSLTPVGLCRFHLLQVCAGVLLLMVPTCMVNLWDIYLIEFMKGFSSQLNTSWPCQLNYINPIDGELEVTMETFTGAGNETAELIKWVISSVQPKSSAVHLPCLSQLWCAGPLPHSLAGALKMFFVWNSESPALLSSAHGAVQGSHGSWTPAQFLFCCQ